MIRISNFSLTIALFSIIYSNTTFGQDTLSLQEAITIGLKNNYSILVAMNNTGLAKNNNTLGNAGFLPRLSASGNQNNTIYSSKTELSDGNINQTASSMTNSLAASIMLNWTVFDGFEMFIQKERLEELQKISEQQFKMEVETFISELTAIYYSIVQQQKKLKILENAMNFSNKRKELAEAKFRLGSASELNYLQALVDLNMDSTALIKQLNQVKNSKTELNYMLARDILQHFIINDSITVNQQLAYDDLFPGLISNNTSIQLSQAAYEVGLLNYRLTNAPKYPEINFFAGYNFSTSKYETGNSKFYQFMGPTFGLSLSYNIFNGFNNRRNTANAKIQINSGELLLNQTISDIQTTFYTLYNNYQTNLELIKIETINIKAARRTTFVAYERYKLGEISDIELRQTQLKELEAENQLLSAQYQAKLLETELLRLSGKLIVQ
jgi:outer membrane protein